MSVNISESFHRTSTNPVDDTLTLTKSQMKAINDNVMPNKYFSICQDDGYIYLYDKSNSVDSTLGKFRKFEGSTALKDGEMDFGGSDRDAYGYGTKEGLSPCDTLFTEIGGNRFAFMPASLITIEYSRDGGSTWTNYGSSDNAKRALFTLDSATSFTIGKADSSNKATTSANYNKYMLRVTINTNGSTCYARFKKFILNISTNGSSGSCCDFQGALQSSPSTFTTIKSGVVLSGWSGYNVINLDTAITTYGNRSDQYQYLRWVFRTTAAGNTSYNGLSVYSIKGFADTAWNVPSTMAKTGHLYSYDENGNASFPAQINAAGGTMTGLLVANTGATHTGIKFANAYITALSNDIIIQNNNAIRFGTSDTWDYNDWAGLKYNSVTKSIYLGIADGSVFAANTAQTGGEIYFPNITKFNLKDIYYTGSKATNRMIQFIDNTNDTYGNGIAIGGGGQTIIGGGESASVAASNLGNSGSEVMYITNDSGNISFVPNTDDGWANRKESYFDKNGDLYVNRYINASGGRMSGSIKRNAGGQWIQGRACAVIFGDGNTTGAWNTVWSQKTKDGAWTAGCLGGENVLRFNYDTDANYNAGSNVATYTISFPLKTGTVAMTSDIPTIPSSLPASDVYAWAKASTKPSYTLDEVSDGSTRKLANYLPLSGGTITGNLTVNGSLNNNNFNATDGNGLLAYKPTGWTAVSSSQWGVGAGNCQGVIRSNNADLIHYKGGTNYTIFDSSNYTTYCATANHTHSGYLTSVPAASSSTRGGAKIYASGDILYISTT